MKQFHFFKKIQLYLPLILFVYPGPRNRNLPGTFRILIQTVNAVLHLLCDAHGHCNRSFAPVTISGTVGHARVGATCACVVDLLRVHRAREYFSCHRALHTYVLSDRSVNTEREIVRFVIVHLRWR